DLIEKRKEAVNAKSAVAVSVGPAAGAKKKLSYTEQREFDGLEGRIAEAEERLAAKQRESALPEVVTDHVRVQVVFEELGRMEAEVEALYARWAELEAKVS
ncbi:MAG: ABC transporter ATP-binding protein, partial [Acidobacteriota bacterium]